MLTHNIENLESLEPTLTARDLVPILGQTDAGSRVTDFTVRHLLEEINSTKMDLKAAYQRDECWGPEMKASLITSLLRGLKIPPLHCVTKPGVRAQYFVLDGKQRLTSVRDFYEGKVRVQLDPKYAPKPLTYREMSRHHDLNIQNLAEEFLNTKIDVIIWTPMPLLSQRDLFQQLNQSKSLNTNEAIYCPNFLARAVIEDLWSSHFHILRKHFLKKEIRENKRFSSIRYVHGLLLLCCWNGMGVRAATPDLGKKSVTQSARCIEQIVMERGLAEDPARSAKVFEIMGMTSMIERLAQCVRAAHTVFVHNVVGTRKFDAIMIQDILCWFFIKFEEGVLTQSVVRENADEFIKMFAEYDTRKRESELASQTTTMKKIKMRLSVLSELFENTSIDKGVKNRGATQADIQSASLRMELRCPICNVLLTDRNRQLDHVNAKSLSSQTTFAYLCSTCNGQKSNMTYEQSAGIARFMNEEGSCFEEDAAEEFRTPFDVRD